MNGDERLPMNLHTQTHNAFSLKAEKKKKEKNEGTFSQHNNF